MFKHISRFSLRAFILSLATPRVQGMVPKYDQGPTVFYANHKSLADFLLLWAVLPAQVRRNTRIVAAEDFWQKNPLRRWISQNVFQAVMVKRPGEGGVCKETGQLRTVLRPLREGKNLILFPEGQRNKTDQVLLPFQQGLYAISKVMPQVKLRPVWLANVDRLLPHQSRVPLPYACGVTFGGPLDILDGEPQNDFESRASQELIRLNPSE